MWQPITENKFQNNICSFWFHFKFLKTAVFKMVIQVLFQIPFNADFWNRKTALFILNILHGICFSHMFMREFSHDNSILFCTAQFSENNLKKKNPQTPPPSRHQKTSRSDPLETTPPRIHETLITSLAFIYYTKRLFKVKDIFEFACYLTGNL